MNLSTLLNIVLVLVYTSHDAAAAPRAATNQTCSRPAEVVFLVDSSRSIWPPDFPHELTFVEEVIGQFDVSPSATRVAVVTFSHGYREEFSLDTYDSAAAMQLAVAKIRFGAGDTTDTHDAIRYAHDVVLSQARAGVPRIIIVITDGEATERERTKEEAARIRQEGILLFAVGVGDRVHFDELGEMATQNTHEFVFTVDDFQGLSSISSLLALQACQATAPPATTTTERPQNNPGQAVKECGGKPADIIFVLDRSSSVYINDFMTQLTMVQDIVRTMDIGPGPNKTQIAAVSFSSNVTVEFYLSDFSSKTNIIDRIAKTQYTGGNTETGQALTVVHDTILSPQHGARSSVAQVVIVITDGQSQDTRFTASAAAALKNDGVKMFAIGVGPSVDRQELESIASTPYDDFLFEVDGYQALHTIQYLLAIKACQTTPH